MVILHLWKELLDEIGEARFDAALLATMRESPYRPDISEIRREAGLYRDKRAMDDFTQLIQAMRTRQCNIPKQEGHPITRTVLALGFGDWKNGLQVVWLHPALDSVRTNAVEIDNLPSFRRSEGEKIERMWCAEFSRQAAK